MIDKYNRILIDCVGKIIGGIGGDEKSNFRYGGRCLNQVFALRQPVEKLRE